MLDIQELIGIRKKYINAKSMFNSQYEVLSKYFYQTKRNVYSDSSILLEGDFLNSGDISDNIGAKCAKDEASAIQGAIWKNEKRTFRIVPPLSIKGLLTSAVKNYFIYVNDQITTFMERTKSRFETSLSAVIQEVVVYGTSGMLIQQGDYITPLRYQQKSILNTCLGYDEDGEINLVIFDVYKTARELVEKYGEERVGEAVLKAYQERNINKRFIVTVLIMPRRESKAKKGVLSMPYAEYVYLPNEKIFLEEGGYETLPTKFWFYDKLEYESYGRSPAMAALPSVIQANVAAEILAVGGELQAQPPLGMYDNGSLAGQTLDLSAAALNVFNVAGSVPSENPVFPIYTIGDLNGIKEWWVYLHEEIAKFFLLDKLYDLNAKQRMTLGEAQIRNEIRNDALAPIFAQGMKFLTEVIERSMDILLGMGLLGVMDEADPNYAKLQGNGYSPVIIPDEIQRLMVAGQDWYDIEYISPAARIMRTDELNASLTFINTIGQSAQMIPEFMDVIDTDGTAMKLKELLSADLVMVKDRETVVQIRQQRGEMEQLRLQVELEREKAKANQSNAQAYAAQVGVINNMQKGVE